MRNPCTHPHSRHGCCAAAPLTVARSAETLKLKGLMSYMYDMLTVRLPKEIEERLTALAKATGRSKSYYAREAIQDKLEDLEDAYLGAAVLERIRKGEERVLSSADMWHGLDD